VDLLPLVFSSGWASGVNAWLVVLVLGVADRTVGFSQVPDVLGRVDVLAVAALLYAVEFVADKVPWVDSAWDAVSTAVRPAMGTGLGLLLVGDVPTQEQVVAAATGGGAALVSHLLKAGIRAGVNTLPEPVSNVLLSLTEDATVVAVVTLAVLHPWVAVGVALAVWLVAAVLLVVALQAVRRALHRRRERRLATTAGGAARLGRPAPGGGEPGSRRP
jgi:Domain of unknown function (DUF4126)